MSDWGSVCWTRTRLDRHGYSRRRPRRTSIIIRAKYRNFRKSSAWSKKWNRKGEKRKTEHTYTKWEGTLGDTFQKTANPKEIIWMSTGLFILTRSDSSLLRFPFAFVAPLPARATRAGCGAKSREFCNVKTKKNGEKISIANHEHFQALGVTESRAESNRANAWKMLLIFSDFLPAPSSRETGEALVTDASKHRTEENREKKNGIVIPEVKFIYPSMRPSPEPRSQTHSTEHVSDACRSRSHVQVWWYYLLIISVIITIANRDGEQLKDKRGKELGRTSYLFGSGRNEIPRNIARWGSGGFGFNLVSISQEHRAQDNWIGSTFRLFHSEMFETLSVQQVVSWNASRPPE